MARPTRTALILSALLVLTNLAWAYIVVDAGVSYSYLSDSYREARGAALQSFAVITASAQPSSTRESVVPAARTVAGSSEPYEKDGYLWIGFIGLKFDSSGRAVEAVASSNPF